MAHTVSHDDTPLYLPFVLSFAKSPSNPSFCSDAAIIDPTHPILEPMLEPFPLFDGWFGIPFTDHANITQIRSVDPTEINNIYELLSLLPLYPTILTSHHLRHILLHCLPLHTPTYVTSELLSDIIAPYLRPDPALTSVFFCVVTRSMPSDST